jgi:hypothetical protein
MKKVCYNCKEEKDISEFHKNPKKKDGVNSTCKDCRRIYHKEHYENNKTEYLSNHKRRKIVHRTWLDDYKKALVCEICNEDRWWVLDFHHIDPKHKDIAVGTAVNKGWSIERIKNEISKCKILCSNCHRDFHYQEKQAG